MSVEDRGTDGHLGDRGGGRVAFVDEPGGQRAKQEPLGRNPVTPGERGADDLQRECPAGPGRPARRYAAGQVRSDDQWPGPDQHAGTRPSQQPVGMCLVSQGAIRVHIAIEDFGHGIGDHQVDPFEGRDQGLFRRGQRQAHGRQARVRTALRSGTVERLANRRQAALAARRRLLVRIGGGRRTGSGTRTPVGHIRAFVVEPFRQFPDGGHADLDDVDATLHQGSDLPERGRRARSTERRAQPGSLRVADQVEQLEPSRPIGVDSLEPSGGQPPGGLLGSRAPARIAQDLGLERQVDRSGCDVERELLCGQVVFDQRGCERQRHPSRQPVQPVADEALDDLRGKRPAGPIDAGHPEHPQHRSFLAAGRAGQGARTPRAGERVGQLQQPVDRAKIQRRARGRHPSPPAKRDGGRPGTRDRPGRRHPPRTGRQCRRIARRRARSPRSRPHRRSGSQPR